MSLRTCETCARPFKRERSRQTKCPEHEERGRTSRSPTTQAQDAEYERERRRILATDPPCHWCGRPHAETVDHVIPVTAGGVHQGNLVPACGPCNFSRKDDPTWTPTPWGDG
jgi:5-methylcytosine-specific restriction endonuclease McrA